MAKTIAQRELRNQNAKVIEAVTAGETFVVTRNGEPVAELRPIRATSCHRHPSRTRARLVDYPTK